MTERIELLSKFDADAARLAGTTPSSLSPGLATDDIIDAIANFPQDNPFVRLNEVAVAGGFPKPGDEMFHNAQDEEELRSAISQITSQIGCIIPLDMEPALPELLTIRIDGEDIEYVDTCDGNDTGWTYVNQEGPYDEIELCADSCNALHNIGTLSANYNCVPQG